jgi:hypothetical protein
MFFMRLDDAPVAQMPSFRSEIFQLPDGKDFRDRLDLEVGQVAESALAKPSNLGFAVLQKNLRD